MASGVEIIIITWIVVILGLTYDLHRECKEIKLKSDVVAQVCRTSSDAMWKVR